MSAVGLVACTAIDACSGVPVTSTLAQQFGGVNPGAMLTNSHSQVMTLTRMGEVGTALGKSVSKLESVWQLGSAGAGAVGAVGQIKGCLGEIVGQGTSLAKQIQAVGKLLQTAIKIIDIVKAANKAVAALMSNPWTHVAARVLASATAIKTLSWIAMVAQTATSIGQALGAVQQATHKTDSTTKAIGTALESGSAGTSATAPVTPPFVPAPVGAANPPLVPASPGGTGSMYPSYPTAGGTGQGSGTPTVFESGWVPARPPAPSPTNITVSVGDFDGDGRNEIRVDVPQGKLNEDLKINVKAKVGNEEVSGTFDIDV